MREWVLHVGDRTTWSATGHLLDAVRTGEAAFELAYGSSVDEYLPRHPDLSRLFDKRLTEGI